METFIPTSAEVYLKIPQAVVQRGLKPGAFFLYAILCDFARQSDRCWPSQATLAKRMGCSVTTVKNHLRELRKEKLIATVQTRERQSCVYVFLHPGGIHAQKRVQDKPSGVSSAVSPIGKKLPGGWAENCLQKDDQRRIKKESPLPPRAGASESPSMPQKRLRRGGGDFLSANRDFEALCRAYPRKEAKELARVVWHRLRRVGQLPGLDVLMAAIDRFRHSAMWGREHGRFVPQLVNWLKGQRWLDEETELDLSTPEEAQLKEELAARKARLEEEEKRRKEAYERETETIRPDFDKFLARFQNGSSRRGPAWGLWCLLHKKGVAPFAADVTDGEADVMLFLKNFQRERRQTT